MAYVTIIVMLALVEYLYFGVAVGRARGRHGVNAPSVVGDENFERFHRAHQNTLEQLIVFVPSVYACAYFAYELLAIICGIVFILARAHYFRSYIADPEKRGVGMIGSMVANLVMIAATLVGSVRVLLIGG